VLTVLCHLAWWLTRENYLQLLLLPLSLPIRGFAGVVLRNSSGDSYVGMNPNATLATSDEPLARWAARLWRLVARARSWSALREQLRQSFVRVPSDSALACK
jgi:hypothetical protein